MGRSFTDIISDLRKACRQQVYNWRQGIFFEYARFCQKSVFEIEKSTDSEIIFLLKESSDTLKHYPFHFELRIIYTLKNDSIHIKYSVTNTDTKTMYFSIGAHEAYACDGGIENYSLVFDTCESFETLLLNDGFLNHKVQKSLMILVNFL